jgi:hypothetical protein
VFRQSVRTAPWYRKDKLNESIPLPVLGPDLYNPKDREALKKLAEAARQKAAAEVASAVLPDEAPNANENPVISRA